MLLPNWKKNLNLAYFMFQEQPAFFLCPPIRVFDRCRMSGMPEVSETSKENRNSIFLQSSYINLFFIRRRLRCDFAALTNNSGILLLKLDVDLERLKGLSFILPHKVQRRAHSQKGALSFPKGTTSVHPLGSRVDWKNSDTMCFSEGQQK